ncbi:molecular chaperone DnaK [Dictyobacter alpinus]|uniref:Molecular chaperone DnaK n=1 Tax=Dictyobacter alpinus TaxID=2014873 RepID=A0A402BIS5_9CHLR|nr:Hsp70 family protein [Dictyobacter alpinus]GCE31239.1 molecular chaperone DnaK [Dictyobacter alpinus]
MSTVVGIDLGTTYSVIAYVNAQGKPEIIPGTDSKAIMPSVVQFTPEGPIIGALAKEAQANGNPDTIAFFKRSMGDPEFLLSFYGRDYTPMDLSALILRALKERAEAFLGTPITEAVITVPAYFTHPQRIATIQAGKAAGLDVLKIISEPTAAALAYGIRPSSRLQRMLVYDLGGGTFDISLVEITATDLTVIATDGDNKLGGKDWDDSLIHYLSTRFEQETGLEMSDEELNDLSVQAEQLKQSLSSRQSAPIRIQAAGQMKTYTISRTTFEELTHDLMARTQMLTEQVLKKANLSWSGINGVLPVGGSTRMPIVRTFIERMSGKPAMGGINPDEAVALGAAIQAIMEVEQRNQDEPRLQLAGRKKTVDVIAHSLGLIAESDDQTRYLNSIIIQKNKPIPIENARPYQIAVRPKGDTRLEVFLTQGETDKPLECTYLGCYVFSDFPAIAGKIAKLEISYAYDKNGVVNISARETSTGQPLKLTIEPLPSDVPDRFALPPTQQTTQQQRQLTVYLAFDLSGSMSGRPLEEAKRAAREFMRQCDLQSTSIGLISFSDRATIDLHATNNKKKIEQAIDGLAIGRTGFGNLAHPFDDIHALLKKQSDARYAVVLTDGRWVNQARAITAAQICHRELIEIIAIGFGGADRNFLAQIASSSEQSLFTDLGKLTETFSTIAQEITGSRGSKRA